MNVDSSVVTEIYLHERKENFFSRMCMNGNSANMFERSGQFHSMRNINAKKLIFDVICDDW